MTDFAKRERAALDVLALLPSPLTATRLRRALESLRRSVDEDGSAESEFALALVRPSSPRVY